MHSYSISVPLVRFWDRPEESLREVQRLGASRVFLCVSRGLNSEAENRRELERLAVAIPFYESAGLEVGVWLSSIGHGGPLTGGHNDAARGFTRLVGLHGRICGEDSFCPLDPDFSAAVCRQVRGIAAAGARMIMLDDDFRLGTRADCGCICDRHMAEYRRRLGEAIAPEDVLTRAFSGEPNRYRQVFYDLMGDTLRGFARQLRAAVDSVNPAIRLGACACCTVWDGDGVDSIELAHILAGQTRPFLRLIGAAYWPTFWAPPADRLAYVAELERMQGFWCADADLELMAEGDVYPRPRSFVPSAYLEAFETILRADGRIGGILKYGVDYCSLPRYETGYADRAERNRAVAEAISSRFAGKSDVGVGVACTMKKLMHCVFQDPKKELDNDYRRSHFLQPEQQLLTNNSIPIAYGSADVQVVFGENARHLDLSALPKGLLLDADAAAMLEARGLDVGLAAAAPLSETPATEAFTVETDIVPLGSRAKPGAETAALESSAPETDVVPFGSRNGLSELTAKPGAETAAQESSTPETDVVPLGSRDGLSALTAKPGAETLSWFVSQTRTPSAYRYENAAGLRVLVLGFRAAQAVSNARFQRSYYRQNQLIRTIEWLGRQPIPASCPKNPDLYLLCKRGAHSMSVGLWNLFPDAVLTPTVTLDRPGRRVEFWNASGHIDGRQVYFDCDIPAFSFAGFEVFD